MPYKEQPTRGPFFTAQVSKSADATLQVLGRGFQTLRRREAPRTGQFKNNGSHGDPYIVYIYKRYIII